MHLDKLCRCLNSAFSIKFKEHKILAIQELKLNARRVSWQNTTLHHFIRFRLVSKAWHSFRVAIRHRRLEAAQLTYKQEINDEKLELAIEMHAFNMKTRALILWSAYASDAVKRKQREKAGDKVGAKVDSFKEKMREAREKAVAAQDKLEKLQREKDWKDRQKAELRKVKELRLQEAQRLEVGLEDDFVPNEVELPDENEASDMNLKEDFLNQKEPVSMKESGLSDFIHNERIAYDEDPMANQDQVYDENDLSVTNYMKQSTEEVRQTITLRSPL